MKQFLALIFLYVPHVHTTAQILLAGIADAQSSRKIQYADWISEGGDVLKATQALRGAVLELGPPDTTLGWSREQSPTHSFTFQL